MGKPEELAKVERAIKEAEARFKTISSNLAAIELEIKKVTLVQGVLIENVRMLKSKQIIAIAQEFKKAKEELRRTGVRLTVLQNDKDHFSKSLQDIISFVDNAKIQQTKLIKESENIILQFRSKNGKE